MVGGFIEGTLSAPPYSETKEDELLHDINNALKITFCIFVIKSKISLSLFFLKAFTSLKINLEGGIAIIRFREAIYNGFPAGTEQHNNWILFSM